MLRSAAHETYHFVENYSAKDAADLRDYVIDALKEKGIDIDKALEKYAKQGPYDTREKQISELVADSMFDVFSNEDFIKKLATDKPKLTRKIVDKIGEWVKEIRSAIKLLSVRGENPEIKALMNDAEKLDTIRNMLLEGYKNAGENFKAEQAKGQKNNAVGTTVKSKKQSLTNINIKGYNIDKKSPLSLENRATANGNSSIKWIYDAEIFSHEKSKLFHQKISEINQGSKAFEKNADDEYMLPIGNKIVFTDGNYDNPYVNRVIEVLTDSATRFEDIKELIYDVEKGRQDLREAAQLMRQIQGDEYAVQYANRVNKVYGWTDRIYKRKNRRAVIADYIRKQNGKGNVNESSENQGVSSSETDIHQIFSRKQTDEITRFNMQTAKENRIYRQIFNLLDDAVYTGIRIKKIPDPKFIRQQAQEMLKEVGSTYSVNELTEELTVIYEYMSQQAGKNLYKTEDFFPNVLAIARRVVDQCTERDSSAYDDAKEIRDVIKETPIYISPEMKNEIISQFGSYLFSSVIFSTCFVKYST